MFSGVGAGNSFGLNLPAFFKLPLILIFPLRYPILVPILPNHTFSKSESVIVKTTSGFDERPLVHLGGSLFRLISHEETTGPPDFFKISNWKTIPTLFRKMAPISP